MATSIRSVIPDKTIGDYWRNADGKPAGFDNLRVILAFAVILWHTIVVCYGVMAESWFWTGPLRPLVYFIVPSFFALSGFLVAGSLLRNDLLTFVSLRVIRIYPALTFEVILSAFIIGLIFTQFGTRAYFSDPMFFDYMLNIIGWIHYDLPGVFLDNPAGRAVNLQLWTVPFELECYLALVLVAFFGLHRRPVAFLLVTFALTAATVFYAGFADNLPPIDGRPPGKMIVLCFLFGVALFLLKDQIRIGFGAFLAALVLYAVLIFNEYGILLAPLFIAYATVYLGVQNKRLPLVGKVANYSYGIYLFGFPMQQVVYLLLPDYRIWWVNFILSILLTLPVAAISWHLIEKRINDNKRSIIGMIVAGRDGVVARFTTIPGYRQARDMLGLRPR